MLTRAKEGEMGGGVIGERKSRVVHIEEGRGEGRLGKGCKKKGKEETEWEECKKKEE